MHWYGRNIEKLQQLSTPCFVLYVTAKALGGVGVDVLLANWLPAWTWWILIVAALAIAIPIYIKVKLFAMIILGSKSIRLLLRSMHMFVMKGCRLNTDALS